MGDLAAALAPHLDPDPHPTAAPGDRLAAVLAIVIDSEAPEVILTERAATMSRHAGEVSFPGGLAEPRDADLRATALRETHEELGIAPSVPRVLGALPPIHTYVSATLVTPFVAVVTDRPALTVSEVEIAAVHVPTLASLAAVEAERVLREEGGTTWRGWWYELPNVTVWGATGFMLHALVTLIRREAPWALR